VISTATAVLLSLNLLAVLVVSIRKLWRGDIVPSTPQGKLFAMCTALLGATHGVTFVALVLQALTQHSPAKKQE
jgi:hypothetical protein